MSDPTRRGELFGGAGGARRFTGPTTGDERRILVDVLRAQRATLRLKCSGLGPELSLRSVEPSTLSLLGLVRHLAEVERRWFRRVLAGQDPPALFSSAADPDGDFDGATDDPGGDRGRVGDLADRGGLRRTVRHRGPRPRRRG
ncbi:hypothetical protein GCM10009579_13030 [Streptomyces javensis]|uniref:DUF664 domain-containing protein n=1 Tax=Streptomyces javensis TaxID=114698 RepID=A0ABP4HAG9_9ACTN